MMESSATDGLADDLLEGASAIATFTGISERRIRYLCQKKLIPVFWLGVRMCARKSELREALRSGKVA
jgi:hypothetical protein